MISRRAVISLLAVSSVLGAGATAYAQVTANKLFFIARSKNANEVHYDARVLASGGLDPKTPVEGYWLNKAEDGSRSSITLLQRIAYGFDVEPGANGTYQMKLKALPERIVTLVQVGGRWRAQATIAGQQAYMNKIYVATDESGVIPSVLYIDIFGEDGSGKPVQEHLKK